MAKANIIVFPEGMNAILCKRCGVSMVIACGLSSQEFREVLEDYEEKHAECKEITFPSIPRS